jgi:tripartite-type tricarboxylate transporter receptor subunit TctC
MKEKSGITASLILFAAAALFVLAGSAQAQDYPTRPIQLVVPYGAGGTTDIFFRTINEGFEKNIGGRVEILNKPGGGGIIGTSYVVNSKPDGYTLVNVSPETTTIAAAFTPAMPYDPAKDLTYIAKGVEVAVGVAVRKESPFKTFEDLVAYAKANPAKLKAGGMGIVGTPHMIFGVLIRDAKMDISWVPFDGGGEVVANLLGGHVDFALPSISVVSPHLDSGKVRLLALAAPKRLSKYPGVPTLAEKGYPKASFAVALGLGGPKGLPPAIVDKLQKAMEDTLKAPKVIAALENIPGVVIDFKNGKDYYNQIMANGGVFKEIAVTAKTKK